jgi:hypothetical protein
MRIESVSAEHRFRTEREPFINTNERGRYLDCHRLWTESEKEIKSRKVLLRQSLCVGASMAAAWCS